MSEIKCEVVRDLMPLVADDVASGESKKLVNEHMEGCEVCRAYYSGLTVRLESGGQSQEATGFVRFSNRMKKRFRVQWLIAWVTLAVLAVVLLCGAWLFADYQMYDNWKLIPLENLSATITQDPIGWIAIQYEMKNGQQWYGVIQGEYQDGIYYVMPMMPNWPIGRYISYENTIFHGTDILVREDGKVVLREIEWDVVYDVEVNSYVKQYWHIDKPVNAIRLGEPDNYTTLYIEGDEITRMAAEGQRDWVTTEKTKDTDVNPEIGLEQGE